MNLPTKIPRQRASDPLGAELRRCIERNDPLYPYSDGKPVGESEAHLRCIRWLLDALEDLFPDKSNVSIHGDMFWYWQEGQPAKNRAPDVMVIFGVPMDPDRLSYKSWDHAGIAPAVIIETASADQEDILFEKLKRDYEEQGVREYFVFDCSHRYLEVKLHGFRLHERTYEPITADADGSMLSKELNVRLVQEQRMLRLINLETGLPILTRAEQVAAAAQRAAVAEETLKQMRDRLLKAGIDPDTIS